MNEHTDAQSDVEEEDDNQTGRDSPQDDVEGVHNDVSDNIGDVDSDQHQATADHNKLISEK